MKKIFGYLIKLVLAVAAAAWLANEPGTVRITWHGQIIETSASLLVLFIFLLAYFLYYFIRFWHVVLHGHTFWKLDRRFRRLRQGHSFITQGLVALAAGDSAEAGKQAIKARKYLGETTPSLFLQAQAAQLAGDHQAARSLYRLLADNPDSATLGYRGLILEARRRGDLETVVKLVEEFSHIKPNTPWLNLIRFELAVLHKQWDEAGKALSAPTLIHLIPQETAQKFRAAILIIRAQSEAEIGNLDQALQAAEQAVRQAPLWAPTILALAHHQQEAGMKRAVNRTIEKHWAQLAHPQLAALYHSDTQDPLEHYKQIKYLCRHNEEADMSHLVLGEAALTADLWGEARHHLMTLVNHGHGTQIAFRLMAKLEKRESGNEMAALQWLTKAADAPSDPVWLCQACGGIHKEWKGVCDHCQNFATLEWQSPGVSRSLDHQEKKREMNFAGLFIS